MNNIWLDIFNSATTFGILTVIAVALVLLLIKRDIHHKSKSSKH